MTLPSKKASEYTLEDMLVDLYNSMYGLHSTTCYRCGVPILTREPDNIDRCVNCKKNLSTTTAEETEGK